MYAYSYCCSILGCLHQNLHVGDFSCGPGYYGDPKNVSYGGCAPCDCNGNIDTSDPGSCNPLDGACQKCLNDTQGNSCEECKDFYWGDAIDAKNCQSELFSAPDFRKEKFLSFNIYQFNERAGQRKV